MGEMDLKIRVEAPFVVYPAEAKPARSLFLSNIDQSLMAPVGTLSFFSNSKMSFEEVVESYSKALSEMLVSYDFIAGRLRLNEEEDRLEIDCNGAGALFAVASSELTMEQLGDITTPNLAFKKLLLHDHIALSHSHHHLPLFTLQATRFRCGSFVVGAALNHCILDGVACYLMMMNLASIARGEGLSVTPYLDRTLLKARVPPQIDYEHHEYSKFADLPVHALPASFSARGGKDTPISLLPDPTLTVNANVLKLFPVSGETLDRLKEKGREKGMKCTSFEVVTALVWKARAAAVAEEAEEEEMMSTVLFPVDTRSKMKPAIPREYAGNMVFPGYARASGKELREELAVWGAVEKVQAGLRRVNDGYARSAVDWLEVHKGIPCAVRSFSVVAWWRLGMEEVEFPWGKPMHFGPVLFSHTQELVLLLPQTNHCEYGLNIAIALHPHQLDKFHHYLQLFLNSAAK
uniref:BAHD acyltransferase-like 19 n=1 Tax=Taxus x media TaxID=85957 RepID=A0A515L533_9CONI|nr:BAHD acyltransferase-like 19 [Taxus x media]